MNTLTLILAGALVVALVALVWLYVSVRRPMAMMERGLDLLKGQDFSSRLRLVGQRDADHVAGIFNDMMDRLRAERLLVRETNRYLDLLVEASPMGIVNFDFDRRVVLANAAALKIFDSRSLDGLGIDNLPGALGREIRGIRKGEEREVRLSSPERIYRVACLNFIDHGFERLFLLVESLTEEVRRAERRTYNQVIRMMAHEVNNSVASLDSAMQTLLDVGQETELEELIRSCRSRTRSMADFISAYASVARLPEPTLAPTDLRELAEKIISLYPGVSAELEKTTVMADSVQLEQAMVNILKNAVESGADEIHVTLKDRVLTVEDNGSGVEGGEYDFRPFFTSKPGGQGVGLTLTADILRAHGARFSLATTDLTRFEIRFPR